jgi:type I restriction enzyme S subunit
MLIDIRPDYLQIVQNILQKHVPQHEVWAFGSRAKWTAKEYSDLDLCIVSDRPLSFSVLGALADDFSDSELPWKVDVVDWATTSAPFRKIIERDKVVIQEAHRDSDMNSRWQTLTLGEIGKIVTGKTPKTSDPNNFGGDIPFVTPTDMDERKIIGSTARYLTKVGASTVKNSIIPAGSIMVSCIGSDMGKSVIAGRTCVTNQQINSIVVEDRFYKDFVYYNLSMRKAELQHLASSGSTMPILNKGNFSELKIDLPPYSVQKEIADVLSALDDRIALLRETNATLEAIAQALFKSWFVDFDPVHAKQQSRVPEGMDEATAALFPDGFEESELGLVPRGWRNVSLKDAVSIHDSKRIPLSGQEREKRKGLYPYYGAASLMDTVDDYLFDGVYLLTGEDGSVADMNGYPIMQYVWGKFWVNNHAHILQGKDGVTTEHVMLAMQRTNITPYITGAVQAKLSQTNMWRINFLKPTREVAEHFGSLLEPLFVRFRHNSEQAQTLATLRDTLLPRLISGQLRLPEAESQIEAAMT